MEANELAGEELKVNPSQLLKPLMKLVSENKDVIRIMQQLQVILSGIKSDVSQIVEQFSRYKELWEFVRLPIIICFLFVSYTNRNDKYQERKYIDF
jgi:hypothetical protein